MTVHEERHIAPRFHISNVKLPRVSDQEQEVVPVLVDARSGLPPRLSMRWVMRSRRSAVSEKTLSDDLRGASLLYAFFEDEVGCELDEVFADGRRLSAEELEKLIAYLRGGKGGHRGIRALTTTGQIISNIERFLRWLAKPVDRGGKTFVSPNELELYHEQLKHTFSELRAFRSRGKRIRPLTAEQDAALERLIQPVARADGRFEFPLRFRASCPWQPATRLRNWIAYRLARELGLRRGEIGKIRVDDIRNVGGHPCIAVRRRPHDPADTRTSGNRPKVKSIERELPISQTLAAAICQYTHVLLMDGGRRGARTPYLLVTNKGTPISGSSLDATWNAVNGALNFSITWHSLRHTWAEETADDLLDQHVGVLDSSEIVLGILRELGGWASTSPTPFIYIRNALKKRGNAYLLRRNSKFDRERANG